MKLFSLTMFHVYATVYSQLYYVCTVFEIEVGHQTFPADFKHCMFYPISYMGYKLSFREEREKMNKDNEEVSEAPGM